MNDAFRLQTVILPRILLLMLLSGCSMPTEERDIVPLQVHLQSGFEGEQVRVRADGRTVFNERIQTDNLIGLAEIIRLEEREGSHHIQIEVDDRFSAEQHFELKDQLFIGVTLYRTPIPSAGIDAGIQIQLSETGFGYD